MTTTQWLFEYFALREKEKDDIKFAQSCVKVFRKILINLLGLDLLIDNTSGEVDDEKEDEDEKIEPFVPLSMMTSRKDVMEVIMKKLESQEQSEYQEDEEFDAISAAIARGDDLGDMAPMFEIDEETEQQLNNWFTPGKIEELRKLGVNITSREDKPTIHIDSDIDTMRRNRDEQLNQQRKAREELKEQLDKEADQLRNRGVKVTFDEDA